jgi:hypothetical protein
MGIAWRWNKEALKRSAFESLLYNFVREIRPRSNSRIRRACGAARSPAKPRGQSFVLEVIEPRLLLSADAPFSTPLATA